MSRNTKTLVDSNRTDGIKNTCITSQKPSIADPLASESHKALEIIDTDINHFDADNIESIQLRQIYSQQARLRELIEQKATMMTPNQVQRLQACIHQIAVISYDIPTRKRKSYKNRFCKS